MRPCLKMFLGLLACLATAASPAVAQSGVYSPAGYFNVKTKSMVDMRYQNMVRQSQDLSCGAAAVATLMNNVYGLDTSESEIIDDILGAASEAERQRIAEAGFSLLEMKNYMQSVGFVVGGFRVPSVDDLDNLKVPVIALINVRGYDHFVVIKKKVGDTILLADPAFGNTSPTAATFAEQWDGVLLVAVAPNIAPNPDFLKDPSVKARPLELNSIQTAVNGTRIALPGEY